MLKFVFIGILVLGFAAFIMWNLWKMALLKHRYFTESKTLFYLAERFKEVPEETKKVDKDRFKLLITTILWSLLIVAVSLAYFLVTRYVFINNHTHSYRDRVITEPICVTEGQLQYKCRYCDDCYVEPIPMIEHKYSESNHRDPTCIQEGSTEYTCEMCADVKAEPIPTVEHNYVQTSLQDPTCIQEGSTEYTCEMCADVKAEPIPMVEHNYVQTSLQDATCTQEGVVEYTCEMCADVKTEPVPLKEHQYLEKVGLEPSCTKEGELVQQCENCDEVIKEAIPVNDLHIFRVSSFTSSDFWKNGYYRYVCQDCGVTEYSLKSEKFNLIAALAIAVLVIAIIVIIAVRADEYDWADALGRPLFWISLLCAIASVTLIIARWSVVIPSQQENKPVLQKWAGAPDECELIEIERIESSYTQNGTVRYQCQKCEEEYTEFLMLKELDPENIPIYAETPIAEKNETKKNNKIDKATEIPLFTEVTGNLSSTEDVDCYKVTLLADGNIKFKFTHEGNEYSYHWNAAIYDTDQSTVINEGYINSEEFGASDLAAGTYYLKISPISGGNPIMNYYSDADYHLRFVPECTNHAETTQSFSEPPSCEKTVEVMTVCSYCKTVVTVETYQALEHSWGEWKHMESASTWFYNKKRRSCTVCDETDESIEFHIGD